MKMIFIDKLLNGEMIDLQNARNSDIMIPQEDLKIFLKFILNKTNYGLLNYPHEYIHNLNVVYIQFKDDIEKIEFKNFSPNSININDIKEFSTYKKYMKETPVGSILVLDCGTKLLVVKGHHPCDKCYFGNQMSGIYRTCKDNPPCSSHKRNDGNDVIFKEIS